MVKKIISVLLVISLLLSFVTFLTYAKETALEWANPDEVNGGESMPFYPYDKMMAKQNPPDFRWPAMIDKDNVFYHLRISDKEDMSNIVYEVKDIDLNVYNFPHTFNEGTYYWQVSYKSSQGNSKWSDIRRFTIVEGALEFPVPDYETALSKISLSRPRIWVTKDNLEYVKNLKNQQDPKWLSSIRTNLYNAMAGGVPKEPEYIQGENAQTLRKRCAAIYDLPIYAGLLWLFDNDRDAAEYGAKVLVEISKWDVFGATSYSHQDQIDREIFTQSAVAYDWLYDFLTEEEKKGIADMVFLRIENWSKYIYDDNGILYNPYNSHSYGAFRCAGVAFLALIEDERAVNQFERVYKIFANLSNSLWEDQDGSHWWGTAYSTYGHFMLETALKELNIINIFNKPGVANFYNWFLYVFNAAQQDGGVWGDASYSHVTASSQYYLEKNMMHNNNRVAQYLYNLNNVKSATNQLDAWVSYNPQLEPELPVSYDRSKLFYDNGFAAMHSDLIDEDKISLYFRSSQFGSDNHAHPDQNSFQIKAYGKELAFDSGYYDSYHSEMDLGYTKKTYAHNAITYNNGEGVQAHNDITSRGKIINYANGPHFDSVSGDAKESYKGGLDKAIRHMIYIRPDIFICIDDLKASGTKDTTFEWWINAKEEIYAYDSKDGGRIINEDAALDFKMQYPQNMEMGYSDMFTGTDYSVQYFPTGTLADLPPHKRIWFKTNKTNSTKIIATMDVHKTNEDADYVHKVWHENYLELKFEDGSTAYIPTGDETHITTKKYEFDGAALVVKGDSFILVDGTSFIDNGMEVIKTDKPVTITYSDYELDFTLTDDTNLEVTLPGIEMIKDKNQKEIPLGVEKEGFILNKENDTFKMTAYKNDYHFYFNNKMSAGSAVPSKNLIIDVDGISYPVEMKGYIDHDGNYKYSGNLPDEIGGYYYLLSKDENIGISDATIGELTYFAKNQTILADNISDTVYMSLKEVPKADVVVSQNTYSKDNLSFFVEAEDYVELGSGKIYTTRAFMSGGAGVTTFNTPGTNGKWKLVVNEAGYYDLVIKYVAFAGNAEYYTAQRLLTLNNNTYHITLPFTKGYGSVESDWCEGRVDTNMYLEPGEYILDIAPAYENWNIDWFGLVKE